ncbi:MAG: 50S ribosomal protein L35 [Omnitrophica bacterium GWA2_52_8]|nr:MAG: 50S ribosomal protein L35 [Omnitrophica bacterium GWA2_52_8]
MPKLKTNKAAKKRFKLTKKGKVLRTSALRRHMMTDRSSKKKRQTRGWRQIDDADKKRIIHMLPYRG